MSWNPNPFADAIYETLRIVHEINAKVDVIMSQDASIAATAADLETKVTLLSAAFASMSSAFAVLQGELAAGTASVSQATMDALAKAEADIDAVTAAGAADAAAETAAAPPPAPPVA